MKPKNTKFQRNFKKRFWCFKKATKKETQLNTWSYFNNNLKKKLFCLNTFFVPVRCLQIHLTGSIATVESCREQHFVFLISNLFFKNTLGRI